jgi:hypothetical protein
MRIRRSRKHQIPSAKSQGIANKEYLNSKALETGVPLFPGRHSIEPHSTLHRSVGNEIFFKMRLWRQRAVTSGAFGVFQISAW